MIESQQHNDKRTCSYQVSSIQFLLSQFDSLCLMVNLYISSDLNFFLSCKDFLELVESSKKLSTTMCIFILFFKERYSSLTWAQKRLKSKKKKKQNQQMNYNEIKTTIQKIQTLENSQTLCRCRLPRLSSTIGNSSRPLSTTNGNEEIVRSLSDIHLDIIRSHKCHGLNINEDFLSSNYTHLL